MIKKKDTESQPWRESFTSDKHPWKDDPAPDPSLTLKEEAEELRSFLQKYEITGTERLDTTPSESFVMFQSLARDHFRDLAGIYSLRDLVTLDVESIEEMVYDFPGMTAALIMDLLLELYNTPVKREVENKEKKYVS